MAGERTAIELAREALRECVDVLGDTSSATVVANVGRIDGAYRQGKKALAALDAAPTKTPEPQRHTMLCIEDAIDAAAAGHVLIHCAGQCSASPSSATPAPTRPASTHPDEHPEDALSPTASSADDLTDLVIRLADKVKSWASAKHHDEWSVRRIERWFGEIAADAERLRALVTTPTPAPPEVQEAPAPDDAVGPPQDTAKLGALLRTGDKAEGLDHLLAGVSPEREAGHVQKAFDLGRAQGRADALREAAELVRGDIRYTANTDIACALDNLASRIDALAEGKTP